MLTQAAAASSEQVVPHLHVFADTVFAVGPSGELEEIEAPMLRLSFEYPRYRRTFRASDDNTRFFSAGAAGISAVQRNAAAEYEAKRQLEGLGAVDLECLDDFGTAPDSDADFMMRIDGDRHDYCGFIASAIPNLRKTGWRVSVADDFPFRVVEEEANFRARVVPEANGDWFALQLGLDIGGHHVDLLPALLDLLDEGSEGDSLARLARRPCVAVPVDRQRHVTLAADQLRSVLRVVAELYEGSGRDMRFHREQADALLRLDEAFSGQQLLWDDPEDMRSYAETLRDVATEEVSEPVDLRATLRPYQRAGLAWLQRLRRAGVGGILADDMGLGKTLQTIAHLVAEKEGGRLDLPAIVIAPTSLMGNWAREIARFAPHLRVLLHHGPHRHEHTNFADHDVVLTSFPLLVRDREVLERQAWHLQIVDEAHTIKNVRSQTHQAAKALSARHRLCLTGTPVENHLGELFSLVDFLNPGLLGDARFFRRWYRIPIEKEGDEERLLALHGQVSPFILRRLKSEVATELPPKTELFHPVELRGKQRELYEAIRIAAHAKVRSTIRKKGFAGSTIAILDALMKLRQLCCDPRLVKLESARFVRESAKTEAFFELTETRLAAGHRILVFSQFTSMLGLLGKGLKERGIRHITLTGATKDRQALCDRFEAGEVDVFLISLKAGGTGLNLVSADTVIHVDPWWNPQAQAQANDRAYRIGQTRPVFVHNLYVAGSVEERMLVLQKKKRRLADAILAGELTQDAGLSEGDVEALLAPLVG
ncbi:MAG: DEAD/DEAH box helicase [Myxococcota bacterium]